MQNINEIRRHIKAVEQTKSLTGAMEMVSSTRMRHVQRHIEYNHMYFDRVQETMKDILLSSTGISHPYIDHRHCEKCAYIVISADKGMCGAYNHNLLNFAYETITNRREPEFTLVTIGEVGYEFFAKHGIFADRRLYGLAQDPTQKRARQLVSDIMDYYDAGLTDAVRIIYTSFYGEDKNQPVMKRLLPIRLTDYDEIHAHKTVSEFMYVPSPQTVFNKLVPQYLVGIVFGVMVQSYASEHFERMTAMQSAGDNADEMLKKFRASYNTARQTAITNEIAEITSAAEALKEVK